MKKTIALLLCFCMLFSFAGCAGADLIAKIKNFNIVSYFNGDPDWDSVQIDALAAGSPYKYYFGRLGNKEKQAYNNILGKIETMPESIEIPALTQDELSTVFEALLYDNPALFFLGRSCTITTRGLKSYFNAEYILTPAEYNIRKQALSEKANEIMAAAGTAGPFETELFVHDYLINNCTYSNIGSEDESTAYGALIVKAAACEGYSKAVKLLMDIAHTDCYVISGMAKNFQGGYESHMWNIVNISGGYYHLDVTWDDPVSIGKNEENDPIYTYFNITDEEIKNTHSDFISAYACSATAENYFIKKDVFFSRYDETAKSKIAKSIAAAANTGRSTVEIKFSDAGIYAEAFSGLFKNQQIYDILSEAKRMSKKRLSDTSVSYIQKDDFNIIELVFKLV